MVVGRTAVRHILPYQHSHAVTVEIPAVCFDFAMLAEHIKAKIFHCTNIVDESFVGRCCIKPVGPVALIQHAALKIWLIIQEKAWIAIVSYLYVTFAECEISKNPVFAIFQGIGVKPRLFGSPGLLHIFRDGEGGSFSGTDCSGSYFILA